MGDPGDLPKCGSRSASLFRILISLPLEYGIQTQKIIILAKDEPATLIIGYRFRIYGYSEEKKLDTQHGISGYSKNKQTEQDHINPPREKIWIALLPVLTFW